MLYWLYWLDFRLKYQVKGRYYNLRPAMSQVSTATTESFQCR